MMTFTSSADLSRLRQTDHAQPIITKLVHGFITESHNTDPVTIALLQSGDADHPLADLCSAEDVTLEGIIEQAGMFLIALKTDYGYGLVLVVPNEGWVNGHLRLCIEQNLYN